MASSKICKVCEQEYIKNSSSIFSTTNGPDCPHCYLMWQQDPKHWKKKIKILLDAIRNNPHKDHKVRYSEYDNNLQYCFTCHCQFKEPEKLPYCYEGTKEYDYRGFSTASCWPLFSGSSTDIGSIRY